MERKIKDMYYLKKIFIINCLVLACSCQQIKPRPFPPMPPEPDWVVYSRKPVVEKIEKNYLVSDEFVESSLQHKQYTDKVLKWKLENAIP